jgi:2-polyprenyl-6-methoxyphenol hydroxylase-like FAD-dependent oxidoreductase
LPFEQIVSNLTPYGFLHILPQDEHECLLTDRLEGLGVSVERSTEVLGYTDEGDLIRARLRMADRTEQVSQAEFIAGCDGARSTVREALGTGFPGGTYLQVFYVADVAGEGPAFNGDPNGDLEESDFLAIFPLADKGRVRLIGAIKASNKKRLDELTFDDISDRAAENLRFKVDKVNWFSVYHVHHRVTEHFRRGRAFVLGDAAHIHTPETGPIRTVSTAVSRGRVRGQCERATFPQVSGQASGLWLGILDFSDRRPRSCRRVPGRPFFDIRISLRRGSRDR